MITNLIWIDPNVENIQNKDYAEEFNKLNYIRLKTYEKVEEAILYLKSLKFEETKVIISSRPYSDFISYFKKHITKINVIPKIAVFTGNEIDFLKYNKDYYSADNAFYSFGSISTKYPDIRKFIQKNNETDSENSIKPCEERVERSNKLDEVKLYFEYIYCKEQLILPLFFKALIENTSEDQIKIYIDYLYDIYSEESIELKNILDILKTIPKIPVEILSKYFIRLYTLYSNFNRNINEDLELNKIQEHLPFIKVLYNGIKTCSLPFITNVILYHASKISNNELDKIKLYMDNKIKDKDSSKIMIYAKSFLSFTKDKDIAEGILNSINDANSFKVLYILEEDESISYNLATNVNLEEISFYSNDKNVLFFPFSSFEINEVKEIKKSNEKIYEIKLSYLSKY